MADMYKQNIIISAPKDNECHLAHQPSSYPGVGVIFIVRCGLLKMLPKID